MVGVAVGHQDGPNGGVGGVQDLLGFGAGVYDDVAFRSVDDVGVYVEAVHGDGYLFDLAQRQSPSAPAACRRGRP
jgi:hypothetical protein